MTSAYEYAESGGHKPPYLQLADAVEKYGVDAILSRRLYAHEVYRMNAAHNVYTAKTARDKAERQAAANNESLNWTKWAEEYPAAASILTHVEKLIAENKHE